MKITFTKKHNFTATVTSSQSKIILCFQFGGQKNQFHKITTLGPETVRKQISDQKIGELSAEQKYHQLILYFTLLGQKNNF